MADGLDAFRRLLKEFRSLGLWAVGGAAIPFVAALLSITPPWPPAGIAPLTSILVLIANVIVFQFLRTAARRKINRTIISSSLAMAVVAPVYLVALSLFTYDVPTDGTRGVKGFACTQAVRETPGYAENCPFLTTAQIGGPSTSAARSGPASAMFLGTISPSTTCR
jgi:uncharacterized membrane protein (GlpM family)